MTDMTGPSPKQSASTTGPTGHWFHEGDPFRYAGQHFPQRQRDICFHILTVRSKSSRTTGSAATAKEILKDVRKVSCAVPCARPATESASGLPTCLIECLGMFPLRTVLVIFFPLVRIRQHLMRLVEFFELPFHLVFFGAGMEVGMVLAGEAAVGFFNVVDGSPP
jgi:hypothetical protein